MAHRKEFISDMNRQLQGWVRIGAMIGSVACLDFAFNIDKKLHPEFSELFYYRIGLTAIGVPIFLLSFISQFLRYGSLSIKLLLAYTMLSIAWLTGRIADDPNYVSGLQLVVMIPIAVPVRYRFFVILQLLSVLLFLTGVIVYKPNLSTPAAAYSMNNLAISFVIALAFAFMLDRIRFGSFMKTKNIELKNAEIELQIARINTLRTQQDGDYFLTAQLLQPLGVNGATESRIKIEFLTEQKKKFQFRHWHSEIGGDLSSTDIVTLRGKRYVAFMNGDAMGKSIQGAGGALVLGTVFKSFMHRTQYDELNRFIFPEQWLHNCYEELHHVMTAFDGRMLVSAVIGLIDEESGFLYYINAEHPWIALLRDGAATFIENELSLRKLGTPEQEKLFRVKTFRLKSGDTLLIGSDGRDDISIGRDDRGNPLMNCDETLFLRIIEKSKGSLSKSYELLKEMGEITDDISFIRIYFEETQSKPIYAEQLTAADNSLLEKQSILSVTELDRLYAQYPHNPLVVLKLAIAKSQLKDYSHAAALGEEYCNLDPSNLRMINLTSSSLKYCAGTDKSLMKRAADYAERAFLREPKNMYAILNLADIYRRLGKREKAKHLLEKASSIDEDNSTLKKLRALLAA
ncbi:MAG: SpoIIE family protein phosphatase [Spirochaetes bacterium]|nr:SpoIIE family protein phosphatase [Spirochaetota bacterium]